MHHLVRSWVEQVCRAGKVHGGSRSQFTRIFARFLIAALRMQSLCPPRKRVRVEGLYLEREPEPKLHAQALLALIQDECPEKVGSFIPCSHLDRAYRELCDHEGWRALSWMAIARALGTLTRRRLLKRNGVRFVAYRLSAPLTRP